MKQDLQATEKWTDPFFSLDSYGHVCLSRPHREGVQKVIKAMEMCELLLDYFPKTRKSAERSHSSYLLWCDDLI